MAETTGGGPRKSFTIDVNTILLHKFDILAGNLDPDAKDTLDITPQFVDMTFYQSLMSPLIRGEMSINDEIGMFVNFPVTGDEVISITYTQKDITETRYFIIESINHIQPSLNLRGTLYIITFQSFEGYFGARTRVSHSYQGTPDRAVSAINDEYITREIRKLFPNYPVKPVYYTGTDQLIERLLVIPNFHPYRAISWCADQSVSTDPDIHTMAFYENFSGFQFRGVQKIFKDQDARQRALDQKYLYLSNEISSSTMKNDGRIVTNLEFNRRISTMNKIQGGYFQNTLFEINLAQKAFWMKETTNHDITTIANNGFNRSVYELFTQKTDGTQEDANKVRYTINNYREGDQQFTNPEYRERWGKAVSSLSALSQVDITVVIPGNVTMQVGDLFYLEVPTMHGFNGGETPDKDDLLTGYFLISEVKHAMMIGGKHQTTLRLNKDSYESSIDRPSKYK